MRGLEFKHTSIFRPGVLDRGDSAKFVEKVASEQFIAVHIKNFSYTLGTCVCMHSTVHVYPAVNH